jgi:hypothetical protein
MGCCSDKGHGSSSPVSGHSSGEDRYRSSLINSEAVKQHGLGVEPEVLANYIRDLGEFAASRVTSIGEEQYGGEIQAFENKSVAELRHDAFEEAADLVAYAAMILIKIKALT